VVIFPQQHDTHLCLSILFYLILARKQIWPEPQISHAQFLTRLVVYENIQHKKDNMDDSFDKVLDRDYKDQQKAEWKQTKKAMKLELVKKMDLRLKKLFENMEASEKVNYTHYQLAIAEITFNYPPCEESALLARWAYEKTETSYGKSIQPRKFG